MSDTNDTRIHNFMVSADEAIAAAAKLDLEIRASRATVISDLMTACKNFAVRLDDGDKWDLRFLELAQHISAWSKDPSTKVGAVIVDLDKRIVSTGYNGLPRGTRDSQNRLGNRLVKYNLIIHAEENAMLYARQPIGGCTIYVSAMPPCSRCAAKIIQTGIARVVAPMPNDDETIDRWADDWIAAQTMYDEAGVEINVVDVSTTPP